MSKRILASVVSSLAGVVACLLSIQPARHFLLAEGAAPGLVRFLSLPVTLADGAKSSWVTVTRTGTFTDPRYGQFDITPAMLAQMVKNFDARVLGQDVFIDVNHKPGDGSAAKVIKLAVQDGRLRALVEWTPYGVDAVRVRGFAYLSAEFHDNWRDNEAGNAHGCVLLGAGLTVRPVIKNLETVQLAELADEDEAARLAVHPQLIKSLEFDMNKHLKLLAAALLGLGLIEAQSAPVLAAAQIQLTAAGEDEAKCLSIVETFTAAGTALVAQIKLLGGAPAGAITLAIGGGLDAAGVAAEVTRLLAQRETAAAADATTLAGKVKLLSDLVNATTTLSEDARAELLAGAVPLLTKEMSDEQVRGMGTILLVQAGKVAAAVQLAAMGYRVPVGSMQFTGEGNNQIKSLQEQVDKRLGLAGMPARKRFDRTGGILLAENKDYAEKCLAEFDALHGQRLVAEHKLLAAGAGNTGDVAVPAIWERTVLREALYNMVGLNFVDVGSVGFANTVNIPYSYRDQTAAGVASLRVYENQGIQRSGIIQTTEEFRPLPQKLSFRLTKEMQYLVSASVIDFDALAENTRSLIRIIGEDTDALIQNEVVRSSDEATTIALNDVLTAQVNGTNRIFCTTQFPVVRPRLVYDLKGVQQGATLNPLVVTLNAVARAEYNPVPGAALAAGLYYVADYNLGEFRFVNEVGVLQTPTNGWVLSIVGRATTNAAKFNLDIGANPDTVNDVYDRALTLIGGRKVVIENDRYYTANMMLMSGAVDNALGQAKTFTANSSRPGSGLGPDGSVATIKGIPAFNTRAPRLDTGDTRIVIGQQRNTRFRMMKPFAMQGMVQQARDANGNFIGAEENWGDQFIVVATPTQLKNANTSVILYSLAGRVARAA